MTAGTIDRADAILPGGRDLVRLIITAGALILAMTAILGVDLSPRLNLAVGDFPEIPVPFPHGAERFGHRETNALVRLYS